MPKLRPCRVFSSRLYRVIVGLLMLAAILVAMLVVFGANAAAEEEYRTFTNDKGKRIEARLVAVDGGTVTVRCEDGRTLVSKAAAFSLEDQGYFVRWGREKTGEMNTALGIELFEPGKSLWSREAADVAKQLNIPKESSTRYESGYRGYWMGKRTVLGAGVYSISLVGGPKKVQRLTFVFANKGDVSGLGGKPYESGEEFAPSEEKVKRVRKLIAKEGNALRAALTEFLGKPSKPREDGLGEWIWNGHRFYLRVEPGEFVSLAVEPLRKVSRTASLALIRKRTQANVSRKKNGDVMVENIPVVYQGPKRYCGPAVFERCMRYLEIPADMYELAAGSGTTVDRGTMIDDLLDAARPEIRKHGASIKIIHGQPNWEDIERTINLGLPLVWAMHATPEYRQRVRSRMAHRVQAESVDEWKAALDQELKTAEKLPDTESFRHVMLIVGYNRQTREIAVSDTTRRGAKPVWLTLREMLEITQPGLTVISPF